MAEAGGSSPPGSTTAIIPLRCVAVFMNPELSKPDSTADVEALFGISGVQWQVPCFSKRHHLTPAIDPAYHFDRDTTLAILAGIVFNRRVLIQGLHGTGKSTHIEQVCARLNWPCVRINLDSHVSRMDLLGRDAIVVKDGKQVTEFQEGLLPWSLRRPVALVFDEYDAGRPDVMFVIQRVLEVGGRLTLLDQSEVIEPHEYFRIFATANTLGFSDPTGLYQGTQQLNQGQIDRWHIVSLLNYPPQEFEIAWVKSRLQADSAAVGGWPSPLSDESLEMCVKFAGLARASYAQGDVPVPMSPRAVLTWAQNASIYGSLATALRLSFINRLDRTDQMALAELYQRVSGEDLLPQ